MEPIAQDEIAESGEEQRNEEACQFDSLKKYLQEISRHQLLGKEDELKLSLRATGCHDHKAMEKLIVSNLRLVVKIAIEYENGMNILDLIQEGNIGLIHAARKFNPDRGTRFSTYASFWIRAYILKYLMSSWSIVKVGTTQNQKKLFYRLNREKARLQSLGVAPTPLAVAASLDVKAKEVEDMEKRLGAQDVSLDDPIFAGGQATLLDVTTTDENIEEIVASRELSEVLGQKIREFKEHLSPLELFVLENRIIADEPVTLQEIGKRFSMSRENVRQTEAKLCRSLTKNLRWALSRGCVQANLAASPARR